MGHCLLSVFGSLDGAVKVCKLSSQFLSNSVYKNCTLHFQQCSMYNFEDGVNILSTDCFLHAVGKIHHSNT